MGDTKSAWPRAPSSAVRALLSAVQIAALILRLLAAAVKSAYGGAWEWTLPTPTQSDQPSKAINQGAHSLQDERLRENTAKTYEKPAETPKALKSQGMSAFDERLGSEAVTDWVEV